MKAEKPTNLPPGTLERRAQTHCHRGHEFTPENTRLEAGHRKCRTCDRTRARVNRNRRTR